MQRSKIISLSAICLLMATTVFSQQDTSATGKVRKNEIGINLAPVAVVLLGGSPNIPELSLNYKRVIGNSALRAGLTHRPKHSNFFSGAEFFGTLIRENDSSLTFHRFNIDKLNFGLFVGFEKRVPRKRLEVIFGMDVIAQADFLRSFSSVNEYERDSTSFFADYPIGKIIEYDQVDQESGMQYTIGLRPFIGILIPLSKRLVLSTSAGFTGFTAFGETMSANEQYQIETHTLSALYVDATGLVSDLSLYFRF